MAGSVSWRRNRCGCDTPLMHGIALGTLALAAALGSGSAAAAALRHCDDPPPLSAAQQDRLFRFSALVRDSLQTSGHSLAIIARAGLDLRRFGQRYSHAGLSLQASPNTPWSVRQLYYDCDQRAPRLFDQGLPGFLLGGADPALGHVVVLLLPAPAAQALEATALNNAQALRLLAGRYSANAHAFSTRYQNCNQWLAELLALAWGGLADGAGRSAAQAWLRQQGYAPTRMALHNPLLMLAGLLLPWLHTDDHPADALAQQTFEVSMPAAIEAFVRRQVPGAQRIEFCHDTQQMVVRQGWQPLADGCNAAAGDRVIPLAPMAAPAAGA